MAALQRTPGRARGRKPVPSLAGERPAPEAGARPAPLATVDVEQLREAVLRFGPEARRAKAALLAALAQRRLDRPRVLADYHDALLCCVAYGDDEGIAALAEGELARCAEAARTIESRAPGTLDGTGLAWSTLSASLSFDLACWLARRFPGEAELTSLGDGAPRLPELLALLLPGVEADVLASGEAPLDLLDRVKGPRGTRLAFLVVHLARLPAPAPVRDFLYDAITPFVTLAPGGSRASRTFARGLPCAFHRQEGPLLRAVPDAQALVRAPLPPDADLAPAQRLALLDTARATLAMLARETDPVTWPATDAVTLHALDRGLAIALFPMAPARRPALDSHTGYLLFRNRVPLAYGGGWPFLGTCRIGINVFPAFRGGESAFAFAQVLRAYHHRFGCRRFVVEPYQFGAGNAEGLRSGAFWFYWRLGFRPVDDAVHRAAAKEAARLARARGARTPLPRMRELVQCDLALDLAPLPDVQRVDAAQLGFAVSAWIAGEHAGDRRAAQNAAERSVRAALDVADDAAWPADERASFRSLALPLAMVPDLAGWSADERAACVEVMRAKGAPDDARYFRLLAEHPRLPAALHALAARA